MRRIAPFVVLSALCFCGLVPVGALRERCTEDGHPLAGS